MKSRMLAGLLSVILVLSATEAVAIPSSAMEDLNEVIINIEDAPEELEILEEPVVSEKSVFANPANEFTIKVEDGKVTIKSYVGTATEVVIPDTIGDAPVTTIGSNAFKDNDNITYVKLPKDLEAIGEYAFYECSKLEKVEFNDGLKTTEKYSFGYCASLEEVILPTTLTKLGDQVFAHCSSLTKVFIPKGLDDVYLAPFRACPLKTITFEEGITRIPGTTRGEVYHSDGIFGDSGIEEVVIPDTVEIIGDDAFHDCAKLKKVTLPKNLKKIQGYAFADCSALEKAIIPEGTETVGDSAYRECSSLSEVFLPKTLTKISDRAFYNTSALKTLTFEEGTTTIFGTNPIYEDIGVFAGSGIESIALPDSVTTLEGCAFAGCKQLTTLQLSPNITSIGAKAFYNCEKLDGIVLPEGITTIKDKTFYNCASLSQITIPSLVTSIGELAFKKCASLKSIFIPKNVDTIEKEAFMDAAKLQSIEFEVHNLYTTTQTLGESAFNGCASLTDVQLGNRIKNLEKNVFANCTTLNEIQIPYGIETITKGAFYKCHNLEILFVPSSVKNFGTTDDEFERSYSHVPLVYIEKGNTDVKVYAAALGWETEVGIWNVDYADPENNEFPDKNLNNQLYEQRVDKNIDTRLTLREIEATKELSVPDLEIEDATGIQLLTSLESLNISGNRLQIIDLSGNTNLTKLNVAGNRLFALGLENNKKISDLELGSQSAVGAITSNDYFDQVLDLPSIYDWQYNRTSVKNITDSYLMEGEEASAEPEGIAWNKPYHVPDVFSYEYSVAYGSGATKTMFVEATLTNAGLTLDSRELAEAFPDGNFRTAAFAALDANKNDKLSRTEERSAKALDVSKQEISSIDGIQRLWNLETLRLDSNKLTGVDLKDNKALKELYVGGNALAAIDTTALTALEVFRGGKQTVSFEGEIKDHVRTIDVTAYDSSFNKENVTEVRGLDASGNETDEVVTVTDTGFSMNEKVPAFKYKWTATKGEMQVTAKLTGEVEPDEPEPVIEQVTVKFSVDDTLLKTETIESGDTIADIIPENEDVAALIPSGNTFIGWYVDGTDKPWDITNPVNTNLSLVAKYVQEEEILADDDDGRDPGFKPADGEYDEDSGVYTYDAYLVKGQTCAFPVTYGYFDAEGKNANEKISWKSSDKSILAVSGKYKVKAKKETGSDSVVQLYDGNTLADSKFIYNVRVVKPKLTKTNATVTIGNTIDLGLSGLGESEKYAEFYNVSWYSSNPEIAKVEDGVVTGYAKGTVKISAYVNGKAYTCSVKVADKETIAKKLADNPEITLVPLQSVSLKFENSSFKVKKLTWYVAKSDGTLTPIQGYDSKGNKVTDKISYYQNSVVRVTPSGKMTSVGVGTTALAAKDAKGNVQYVTVTVNKPVTNTVYINLGKNKTLKYYNVKAKSGNAVWSSTKSEITGNCANGKVTGEKAGAATVTCSYDPYNTGNPIIYKTLVVVENPRLVSDKDNRLILKQGSSTKGKLELKEGERYAINANLQNQKVIFSSSKQEVAFVNDAGVIIARKSGKATITANVNGTKLTINLTVK